jgi:hypothetical protein
MRLFRSVISIIAGVVLFRLVVFVETFSGCLTYQETDGEMMGHAWQILMSQKVNANCLP